MKIEFAILNTNTKKIDKMLAKRYNNKVSTMNFTSVDTFSYTGGKMGIDKNTENEITRLKQSSQLQNSLVSFIPSMLDDYFSAKMDKNEFARSYIKTFNKQKLYLALMDKELRKENQQVFKNELILADSINDIALRENETSKETFDRDILSIVKEYNDQTNHQEES